MEEEALEGTDLGSALDIGELVQPAEENFDFLADRTDKGIGDGSAWGWIGISAVSAVRRKQMEAMLLQERLLPQGVGIGLVGEQCTIPRTQQTNDLLGGRQIMVVGGGKQGE